MKHLKDLSVRTKYILILALCVGLPVFLLGMWFLHQRVMQQQDMLQRNTLNQLSLTAESVDSRLKRIEQKAYELCGNPEITDMINGETGMKTYVTVKRLLNSVVDSEDDIRAIQIFQNGEVIIGAGIGTLQTEKEAIIFEKILTDDVRRQWGPAHVLYSYYHGKCDQKNILTPYYGMIYSDGRFSDNGVLAVYVDEEALYEMFKSAYSESTQRLLLVTEQGFLMAANNEEEIGTEASEELMINLGMDDAGDNALQEKERSRLYWSRCGTSDRFLCKTEEDTGMIGLEAGYIILFLLLMLLLIGGCVLLHNYYISIPLEKLSGEMEACIDRETEKLNPITVYDKNDEIGRLSRSSNQMVTRVNELIDSYYLEKIRAQQAQLDLIGAQINPHFLFNTIDSIHWTALANNDEDVGEQLEVLSDFLREMLNFGMEDITIAQEIDIIHNYCYLIQKRYLGTMKINETLENSLMNCRISKLLIQPLVENAFTHGLEKNLKTGEIWLIVREKRERLQIIVMDNGKGCDGKNVRREMDGEAGKEYFALRNIRERLRLKYGDEGKLVFYSKPGRGTFIRVELPVSRSL